MRKLSDSRCELAGLEKVFGLVRRVFAFSGVAERFYWIGAEHQWFFGELSAILLCRRGVAGD